MEGSQQGASEKQCRVEQPLAQHAAAAKPHNVLACPARLLIQMFGTFCADLTGWRVVQSDE